MLPHTGLSWLMKVALQIRIRDGLNIRGRLKKPVSTPTVVYCLDAAVKQHHRTCADTASFQTCF